MDGTASLFGFDVELPRWQLLRRRRVVGRSGDRPSVGLWFAFDDDSGRQGLWRALCVLCGLGGGGGVDGTASLLGRSRVRPIVSVWFALDDDGGRQGLRRALRVLFGLVGG